MGAFTLWTTLPYWLGTTRLGKVHPLIIYNGVPPVLIKWVYMSLLSLHKPQGLYVCIWLRVVIHYVGLGLTGKGLFTNGYSPTW